MNLLSLAFCWLFMGPQGPDFSMYDPAIFQLRPIENITSPTGILVHEGRLYLSADHLDPRPGLYGLHHHPKAGWRAGLLQILPQQHIDSLGLDSLGNFRLVSSRLFTVHAADWVNQVILLSPNQYNLADIWKPPVPNQCSSGDYQCGLTGMVDLPDGSLLAVTRKGPAKLHQLRKVSGEWRSTGSWPLAVKGRYVTISDLAILDGSLVFLLKNKWMLASLDPAALETRPGKRLELKALLDFSGLKKQLRVGSPSFLYAGLAEGFAVHPDGRLLVLLNNRGYEFKKSPDQVLGDRPKLLVFPPRKSHIPQK